MVAMFFEPFGLPFGLALLPGLNWCSFGGFFQPTSYSFRPVRLADAGWASVLSGATGGSSIVDGKGATDGAGGPTSAGGAGLVRARTMGVAADGP
jgi:hypothetical protein